MSTKKKREIFLICHNIRSLHNVGAMFRTADVFGVSKIYLCGYTGTPPRKEITKVALGAEEWIPWEYKKQTGRLLQKLKSAGVRVVALETVPNAKPLSNYKPKFPLALIVGNEVTGIPEALLKFAHDVVAIPMTGKKESLNVSVAAGVALYGLRY